MTNTVTFPGLGLEFALNRVAFNLFGHNIYWYGIIIAAGFLLAVIYGLHIAPRFGMDPETIIDAIFFVVPSAIIGARLYYVVFNPIVCFELDGSFSLLRAVAFWDGGLAIYGGVIATVVSALLFCKFRKVDFWSGMDVTVYGLLIGQIVGRWGNFVNVECYGSVTGVPWRMCSESIASELLRDGLIQPETVPSVLDGTLGVHPTFLYESLWNLLGLILLVLMMKKGRRFNGQMFLSYIVWYGLGRAVIEGMRTDSLYFFGTSIRSSLMLGIVSALAGIGLIVLRVRTAGPATPPIEKAPAGEVVCAAEAPRSGDETQKQPIEEPVEEPMEEPVEESIEESMEEPGTETALDAEEAKDDHTKEEAEHGGDTD